QKSFLAFLVAMGITVTLSDADCDASLRKPGQRAFSHPCHRTSESSQGNICLLFATNSSFRIIFYDKNECKLLFRKERCNYDVVQKDDPSKPCRSGYSRTG
uniref:BPTI/Kunitz inhibitor domain-containing protein n=1 Tax=Taeniopygia guttata TaxID=59729 RepID=A0A674HAS0_TAEGU